MKVYKAIREVQSSIQLYIATNYSVGDLATCQTLVHGEDSVASSQIKTVFASQKAFIS